MKAKIVLEILKEEKSIPQTASTYGIHPSILNRWKNAAVEKLPSLFADDTKSREHLKAEYEKKIQDLYTEIGRLTTELAWLKKRVASELGRDKRLDLVEWNHPEPSTPFTVPGALPSSFEEKDSRSTAKPFSATCGKWA